MVSYLLWLALRVLIDLLDLTLSATVLASTRREVFFVDNILENHSQICRTNSTVQILTERERHQGTAMGK